MKNKIDHDLQDFYLVKKFKNLTVSDFSFIPRLTPNKVYPYNDLCDEEFYAVKSRQGFAKPALEKFTGQSIDDVPQIAIAASGGGVRASIVLLGLLYGLKQIGLLDGVTYLATLSGSTWSTASWMIYDCGLEETIGRLQQRLTLPVHKDLSLGAIKAALSYKEKYGKKSSINDLWGAILGNIYFQAKGTYGLGVHLSDLAPTIATGKYPLPLFASIIGNTSPHYQWMEFSPFAVGSSYLCGWVNPSDFGKTFNYGQSTDKYPGETFSYLLGLFGAFYAANVQDIINDLREELEAKWHIHIPDSWIDWGNKRVSPPQVPNFVKNMQGRIQDDPLQFMDAGATVNIPVPLLLRRGCPLIIICDASDTCLSPYASPMIDVYNYAKEKGYRMPPIDYTEIVKKPLSILYDPYHPGCPIIIYIPNFNFYSSEKFQYTQEEFFKVFNGIAAAVTNNKDLIRSAVIQTVENL